jgi:hypothetical protein
MKQILLLALLITVPKVTCAQKSDNLPLGWDLTYTSVLNANHVRPDDWIRKWLPPNYESPIKQLISTWNHEAIESAVLLEFPALHAGEHITIWCVRTRSEAYYIELVEDDPPHETKEALRTQEYDKFFGVTSRWQQAKPLKSENTPENAIPGYSGFLSFHDRRGSRQMLLTSEDFVICDTKKCDRFKPGRLAQAFTILSRFKV